jgi:hypothetical protein
VEYLQQELGEANVDLKVKKIDEVASIACDDVEETTEFTSHVSFDFAASMDVAYSEVNRFADILAGEYKILVMAYCDPLIRRNIALDWDSDDEEDPDYDFADENENADDSSIAGSVEIDDDAIN